MYKECLALCDFVNEEIRKFSCSALMHLALGMFKISNNDAGLKEAVKKALEMIQQDTDNGVALLLMAELSDVIDKYGKPLFTREVMECVINALKGELICMMGKFHKLWTIIAWPYVIVHRYVIVIRYVIFYRDLIGPF